ncbi:2-polyprenyl-6-methoxyphenol hydroxylase [Cyclobacterium plantarum]|uniref:2-polyprenyl-6-methoxyphenol hydroxylase n=1 Tax=Cyclobacterium plantarum TaxID=2716263 RepID=UPI003F724FF4
MMAIKNLYLPCLWVLLACTIFSCTTENEADLLPEEERCGEEPASLSGDIIPIINQNCAISGCHVSGSERVNLSVPENIIQYANQIRNFTQSGFMPAPESGKQLTAAELESIYCWVENGALDN